MAITYRGERFSGYNKPKRTPCKRKKFAVLAKKGDKVKLVRFGDPKMTIKKEVNKQQKMEMKLPMRLSRAQGKKTNCVACALWVSDCSPLRFQWI